MDPAACQDAARHFDLNFAAKVCEATYARDPALQQQSLPETVVPHSVPRSHNAPVGWSPERIGLSSAVEGEPECRVHRGFQKAVCSLFDAGLTAVLASILQGFPRAAHNPLLVTGHSLGGAMGTLIALDFVRAGYTVDLVTFGAPMVGNAPLSKVLARAANPSTPFFLPVAAACDSDSKAQAGGGGAPELGSNSNQPRLWTFRGRTRGLLCCVRVVNSMDIVPMSMAPLKPYVHYPAKALVLDEFWEAVSPAVEQFCDQLKSALAEKDFGAILKSGPSTATAVVEHHLMRAYFKSLSQINQPRNPVMQAKAKVKQFSTIAKSVWGLFSKKK